MNSRERQRSAATASERRKSKYSNDTTTKPPPLSSGSKEPDSTAAQSHPPHRPSTGRIYVPHALRLAQGALAVAAGVIVARVARRSAHALWLVPMSVVLARLAFDPVDHLYYFDGVQAAALVALALVAARGLRLPRLAREPLA